jgi:hypothetical protein
LPRIVPDILCSDTKKRNILQDESDLPDFNSVIVVCYPGAAGGLAEIAVYYSTGAASVGKHRIRIWYQYCANRWD